jgi:hypothetical protein
MNQSIAPQGFDVTAAHLAALLSPSLSPFIDSLEEAGRNDWKVDSCT